jgi:prolyl 4-hydroxylase
MNQFAKELAQCDLAWTDAFVPPRRCAFILDELQFAFWHPSSVVRAAAGGPMQWQYSNTRISSTANEEWFSAELRHEIRGIERRVARLVGQPPECFETWQATHYRTGGRFDFHNDAGYWTGDAAGERRFTVLLYLQQPEKGGSTRFRELRKDVEPVAGRLLVWKNLLPGGERNPRMIHASAPVRKGNKTVLVTWVRERPFHK